LELREGGGSGIAEQAAEALKKKISGLSVTAEQGGQVEMNGQDDDVGEEARHRLTLFAPQILLVAFGHPKQERWIARHLVEFPSVKIVIGIGGAFDFWADTIKRAPFVIRRVGLEWLWRLILEPRRWKRIWNAVIVFPIFFIFDRVMHT